jgi:hypothetical protein
MQGTIMTEIYTDEQLALLHKLEDIKLERARIDYRLAENRDQAYEAVREGDALRLPLPLMAEAVGLHRSQVHNYVTGRRSGHRAEHAKLDQIGAPK